MSIEANKVWALLKKDFKDTMKNGNVLLLAILPLAITVLYRFINIDGFSLDGRFIMSLGVLMTMTLLPLATMSMMIAEEKEKNTLRTLMLSNVSAGEFLISKSLVIFALMSVCNTIIYLVSSLPASGLPLYWLATAFASVNMIFFGALIGILSKNQMSTGMIASPLALVMLIPSLFAQTSEGFALFARFIPTYAMTELINNPAPGALPWIVIAVWTILAAVLFGFVYQRKRLDT